PRDSAGGGDARRRGGGRRRPRRRLWARRPGRASRRRDRPLNPQPGDRVGQRIGQLPDIRAYSLRQEVTGVELDGNGQDAGNGVAEVIGRGPRGYAIVGGRDLSGRPGEVVVDRGFAQAWGLGLGGTLAVGGLPPQRIVGFAEEPDNVA